MKSKDFQNIVLDHLILRKPKRQIRKDPEIRIEDLDLAEVFLKLEEREKKIKSSKEIIEKLMKKEEKKDDKKSNLLGITTPQLAMLLIASFPITAPLYVNWFKAVMGVH